MNYGNEHDHHNAATDYPILELLAERWSPFGYKAQPAKLLVSLRERDLRAVTLTKYLTRLVQTKPKPALSVVPDANESLCSVPSGWSSNAVPSRVVRAVFHRGGHVSIRIHEWLVCRHQQAGLVSACVDYSLRDDGRRRVARLARGRAFARPVVPYQAWVTFAYAPNFTIWQMHP